MFVCMTVTIRLSMYLARNVHKNKNNIYTRKWGKVNDAWYLLQYSLQHFSLSQMTITFQ